MANADNLLKNKLMCSSKETKKALKVNDCELMHMRLSGQLKFEKRGNAYFYLIDKNKIYEKNKPPR